MSKVPFRYTFGISKAEERPDGLFIIGEASGPEVDATDERMATEAISRFAAQIRSQAEAGNPLPYRDAHAQDGVLRDLGSVTDGWLDERFHLGVEVKLDDDSPSALYLFRSIQKGKQFGMSIAGTVLDFKDEFVAEIGKTVRTYKDIVLTEISNTTRPAWTPSFGTVLSKAIDAAQAESLAKTGDTVADNEDTLTVAGATDEPAPVDDPTPAEKAEDTEGDDVVKDDAPEVQDEAETAKSDDDTPDAAGDAEVEATEKSDDATEADEAGDAEVTEKATEDAEDIEKAGRTISASNGKRLLALHREMTSMLEDLGLISVDAPAKSDSQDAESDLYKSLTAEKVALEGQVEELKRQVAEKTARVEELESMPVTKEPALIERSAPTEDEIKADIAKMSPIERMRLGLALAHSE